MVSSVPTIEPTSIKQYNKILRIPVNKAVLGLGLRFVRLPLALIKQHNECLLPRCCSCNVIPILCFNYAIWCFRKPAHADRLSNTLEG